MLRLNYVQFFVMLKLNIDFVFFKYNLNNFESVDTKQYLHYDLKNWNIKIGYK